MGMNSFHGQRKVAYLVLLKACDLQREKENFRKPKDSRCAQADKSLLVGLPVPSALLVQNRKAKTPPPALWQEWGKATVPRGAGRQGWSRGLSFVLVITALSFTLPFIY